MARDKIVRTVGSRQLHEPGRDEAAEKGSRLPGLPGRLGELTGGTTADLSERGKAETSADGLGTIHVRGDGPEVAAEVQFQLRAQTGTTAGAGKRTRGGKMGTTLGLPIDEPRHGEVVDADSEAIEGGNVAIEPWRKLGATE